MRIPEFPGHRRPGAKVGECSCSPQERSARDDVSLVTRTRVGQCFLSLSRVERSPTTMSLSPTLVWWWCFLEWERKGDTPSGPLRTGHNPSLWECVPENANVVCLGALSRQKKKAKNLTKEQAVVLAKDDYCLVFGACFRRWKNPGKILFLSITEVRFICFLCLFVSATYFQQKTAVSVKNRPAGSIRILKVANWKDFTNGGRLLLMDESVWRTPFSDTFC